MNGNHDEWSSKPPASVKGMQPQTRPYRPRKEVARPVLKYMSDHANTIVYARDIDAALDLYEGAASGALARMAHDPEIPVRPGRERGTYVYNNSAPTPTTSTVYETVGRMKDRAIIRDENQQLYVAIPLDAFYEGRV